MVGNVSQVGSAFYQQFFCVDSTIANCTVSGNVATDGPAIASMEWSSLDVVDCVIWDNSVPSGEPLFAVDADSVLTVTYGCIEGGWEGQGNIDADPVFTDPGYWDDNGTPGDTSDDFFVEGDYHLSSSSPCIDAGDPASTVTEDIEGSPRNDGRVDMGAYEYQP